MDQRIHDAIEKMIKDRRIACEELTEKQLAEALKQALACGDFKQHCMICPGQEDALAVTYIPYREHSSLKEKIKSLESTLNDIRRCIDNEHS